MRMETFVRRGAVVAAVWLATAALGAQRPLFTDSVPKEEFARRRARVLEQIGDGVVLMQGTIESGYLKFRQSNQFFYLTGVEVPRALLLMDGRTKDVTLFLAPRNERMERSEGPVLVPGEDAQRLTGIPQVLPRDALQPLVEKLAADKRVVYMPHRAEALGAGAPEQSRGIAKANQDDPWDGRLSREASFIVMAWLGLVPSEHSSGASRHQGPITRSGNRWVRSVLVEAAWAYRYTPKISPIIERRAQQTGSRHPGAGLESATAPPRKNTAASSPAVNTPSRGHRCRARARSLHLGCRSAHRASHNELASKTCGALRTGVVDNPRRRYAAAAFLPRALLECGQIHLTELSNAVPNPRISA